MGFLCGPCVGPVGSLDSVSDSEMEQIRALGISSIQVSFAHNGGAAEPAMVTAGDVSAVKATNFCSLWPAAKPALTALLGVVSNPFVKAAISTVIAAGDAYCSS